MTETTFKPLNLPKAGSDELDGYLQERGVPVLKKPETIFPPVLKPVNDETRQVSVMRRVPVEMPDYLAKALRTQAAERGCTVRYLVLSALTEAGWTIKQGDMQEDGRRKY